jgi:hypothetical protein
MDSSDTFTGDKRNDCHELRYCAEKYWLIVGVNLYYITHYHPHFVTSGIAPAQTPV